MEELDHFVAQLEAQLGLVYDALVGDDQDQPSSASPLRLSSGAGSSSSRGRGDVHKLGAELVRHATRLRAALADAQQQVAVLQVRLLRYSPGASVCPLLSTHHRYHWLVP